MARALKSTRQRVQAEASAARAKAAAKKKQQAKAGGKPNSSSTRHAQPPAWTPFDTEKHETVLLVGEGDFSFGAALATQFGAIDVVATSLDTAREVADKYGDGAQAHLQALRSAGSEVIHGVNAEHLTRHRFAKVLSARGVPLKVVFNFPHLGNSMSDQDRNIRQHQELLLAFFKEARAIGASSVVVALFAGQPYEAWQPKQLARAAGWHLERSGRFAWEAFPGYSHQLTSKGDARTSKEQRQREARMFLWVLPSE